MSEVFINKQQCNYQPPCIIRVVIDNEMSLALMSYPPVFESENQQFPASFSGNPLKEDLV